MTRRKSSRGQSNRPIRKTTYQRNWGALVFRSLASALFILVFSYGLLINHTIGIAAETRLLNNQITEMSIALTTTSSLLALAEDELQNLEPETDTLSLLGLDDDNNSTHTIQPIYVERDTTGLTFNNPS